MGISYQNPYPWDGGGGSPGGGWIPKDPPYTPPPGEDIDDKTLQEILDRLESIEEIIDKHDTDIDNIKTIINKHTLEFKNVEKVLEEINNKLIYLEENPGAGEGGPGVNGAVFITDITPQGEGNVGQKVYSSDGKVLEKCITDTNLVTISVLAITGHSNYKPVITINNNIVELSESSDSPIFTGSINIDLEDSDEITAIHEDGAKHTVTILHEEKPQIVSAIFVNGYPKGQTELKEGDTFDLRVETNQEIVKIEIADESACKHLVKSFAPTKDKTIQVTIANRGNVATLRYAKLRVQKETGSWSDWYRTDSAGNVDGVYVVNCNNLHPTITLEDIIYPTGQKALKDNEKATIKHSINNFDTATYQVLNNELKVNNQDRFESEKTVQRINGNYNVSKNNLKITAKRNANNAITTKDLVVKIAHSYPTLTVETQYERLRSAPTGAIYSVNINSDQELLKPPTLIAPYGTWQGSGFTGGPQKWVRNISISDADQKGTHSWSSIAATNLAGRVVTAIDENNKYTIGGFLTREIYFDPFKNMAPIGTNVTDVNKLVCIDISGDTFTYQVDKTPNDNAFTIVDKNGDPDPEGDYIWIADQPWVEQNSTGLAFVELQELV